jgi:hypothetical protein
MSYLTQSEEELWDEVVAGLEGEGFAFNPLTTSRTQYLATALGEPDAYLTKSFARLVAEVNGGFGGSLSYLTSSPAQLLDDLDTNIGAGGGGEELPAPPEGFHYIVNADGEYIVNAGGAYILADGDL